MPDSPTMTGYTEISSTDRPSFLDAVERVTATFVQALIVFVLAAPVIDDGFLRSLLTVAIIAAADGVKVLLTVWVPTFDTWLADAAYRTVSTFVVGFAGQVAAVEVLDAISLTWAQNVAISSAMAALAVLKALIARRRPPGITPASLITASGDLAA